MDYDYRRHLYLSNLTRLQWNIAELRKTLENDIYMKDPHQASKKLVQLMDGLDRFHRDLLQKEPGYPKCGEIGEDYKSMIRAGQERIRDICWEIGRRRWLSEIESRTDTDGIKELEDDLSAMDRRVTDLTEQVGYAISEYSRK